MQKRFCSILTLALFITLTALRGFAQDQKPITPEEAAKSFGQAKIISGKVISPK
jgi:hypothetical protein